MAKKRYRIDVVGFVNLLRTIYEAFPGRTAGIAVMQVVTNVLEGAMRIEEEIEQPSHLRLLVKDKWFDKMNHAMERMGLYADDMRMEDWERWVIQPLLYGDWPGTKKADTEVYYEDQLGFWHKGRPDAVQVAMLYNQVLEVFQSEQAIMVGNTMWPGGKDTMTAAWGEFFLQVERQLDTAAPGEPATAVDNIKSMLKTAADGTVDLLKSFGKGLGAGVWIAGAVVVLLLVTRGRKAVGV